VADISPRNLILHRYVTGTRPNRIQNSRYYQDGMNLKYTKKEKSERKKGKEIRTKNAKQKTRNEYARN